METRAIEAARTSWATARLEDVVTPDAKILYGILQPGPDVPDGVPYVRPTEMDKDTILLDEIRRTTPAIAAKYKRSVLATGDILLSIVGTIGKVAVVPEELEGGNITQSSVRIRPGKKLDGEFLAWYLRSPSAFKQYDSARLGTAVPRLNVAHVRDLTIPIPSLPEQRWIVSAIETQLGRLDAAVARLHAAKARLKRYKQAVLFHAFGNEDWQRVRLVEAVEKDAKILYGILQPGPDLPDGVPYVRPTEIENDVIDLSNIRRTSPAIAAKYKRSLLKAGDVILSIVGTIGKVAVVPGELEGGNITQSSVRIRPMRELNNYFLTWYLRSPHAFAQYDAARLGTAVPRLNVAHVRDLLIPVPSLKDQLGALNKLEKIMEATLETEATLDAQLLESTRLRQAVLKRAFEGRLV